MPWFRGVGKQPHTAECRERYRKLMSDDARVQLANQKRQRFAGPKNRRENEERRRRGRTKHAKRNVKKRKKEEETSRKRTCQSGGSSDGVVIGHGSKRKMEDDLGDDQMQMETEEIAEVEVQRWIDVMLVEEEQIELKDCESTFVEERELDLEKVKEARFEEVQFMQKKRLWDVVPWPKDGRPVSLRWVDVVKVDGSTGSRLVARDFKSLDRHRDDFFAATPPLEAVRAVLSMAVKKFSNGPVKKVMMIDAKKAHLNPRLQGGRLHRATTRSRGRAGKLNFWLYGFRKAASAWEDFYAEVMEEAGFRRGVGCSVIFRHEEKDLLGVIHGDDFVFGGNDEDLK